MLDEKPKMGLESNRIIYINNKKEKKKKEGLLHILVHIVYIISKNKINYALLLHILVHILYIISKNKINCDLKS